MKIKLKKLNSRGFGQHVILPILAIVAVAGIGAYVVVHPKAATPSSKGGGGTTTSSVYTYQAKDMYAIGSGVSLVTSGKGKTAVTYQEFAQGSSASLYNQTNVSTLQAPLNNWITTNNGKTAKLCVNAMSVGATSSLWFTTNALSSVASDGNTYTAPETNLDLTASTSYAKYCSPAYKVSTAFLNGNPVTFSVNMNKCQWVSDGSGGGQRVCSFPSTSGPLRIQSISYELQ